MDETCCTNLGSLLPVVWTATVLSCFFTVLAGYLLYLSGEYQGDLIRRHLWGGVGLTVVLAGSTFLRFPLQNRLNKKLRLVYPSLLAVMGFLAIYTSHLGGSITHGPDFLTAYLPSLKKEKPAAIEQKPPQELLVFQDLIMPALENKCLSCHNEHKTKGGLLMTSFTALAKGGKSEKTSLVAGQPQASEFYHRIVLPANDEDRMPPPEKPGLSEDEITLIHWWIEEGASPDQMLGEGPTDAAGQAMINRYLPTLFRAERLKARQQTETAALAKELKKLGEKLNLVIKPDADAEGFFAVSMSIPPSVIDDQTISKLLPYAEVFSKISLPGSLITDDGLYELSKMPHLQKLFLPKTCIKGEGLPYLESSSELKELNLSYSYLTDEGALHLLKLPQLEKVYVFGTETDSTVLNAMRKNQPVLQVLEEEGPYY